MNFGILNNKRSQKGLALSSAELKFEKAHHHARSMGIDIDESDSAARGIWDRLSELSRSDPEGYRRFLKDHLLDDHIGNRNSDHDVLGTLFPRPGYVLKCRSIQPGDSYPVKLFLNICTHQAIDRPINPNSEKSVPDDPYKVPVTNNLRIPLLVGPLRTLCDTVGSRYKAIDVVFNSWVTSRCEWDQTFKREVLKLAAEWVQHDAGISITATPKYIKCRYKGGIHIGKDIITAKLRVDESGKVIDTSFDGRIKPDENGIAKTPADLVRQLQDAKENESNPSTIIDLHLNVEDHVHQKSISMKPLIEIVESSTPTDSRNDDDATKCCNEESNHNARSSKEHQSGPVCYKPTKSESVMKKGFLSKGTDPKLYPSGSNEGRKPSALVNLLSRSKVFDLNRLSPVETRLKKSSGDKNTKYDMDHEFEQLCLDADPELSNGQLETCLHNDQEDVFQTPFLELSNMIGTVS